MTPSCILLRESTDAATFEAAVWGGVFNLRRDTSRVPAAVCRARTTADVVAGVELARARGWRVSIRSGGHSWAAWSVRQDAVLLDLGQLHVDHHDTTGNIKGPGPGWIDYDEATGIVSCPPATTGQTLNGVLAAKGRMFAGGHCPDVGLGGFLLQGGMGWNCKNWGWACEAVAAIDAVTADGEVVHCCESDMDMDIMDSDGTGPGTKAGDLFWAARGAGPGFPAVVTRFHLRTRPLLQLFHSVYVYPLAAFRAVLAWAIEAAPTADPDTEMVCVSSYSPGATVPTVLAHFTTFKPSLAAAKRALSPLDGHAARPPGATVAVFCQPTSLAAQYADQAAANPGPATHRYCSDNAYIRAGDDDDRTVVPAILERAFTTLPSRQSCALWFSMNPTSRRPGRACDAALSMQSDHYFALYAVWEHERDDAAHVGWVHDTLRAVEPHAVGSYLGDADFRHRTPKFWTDECAARLRDVRRAWDPDGRVCGFLGQGDRSGVDGLPVANN
ncbi:FAD binding domain protein [Podospora appendiculata]|uniref:FAD binding domain protein n=1 Tax=Podospora appendiculata TaxID=314037 RepID=A0AAE0XGG1_9PEZI|nr:FAD binding domain protein [Podospora appendiculata]